MIHNCFVDLDDLERIPFQLHSKVALSQMSQRGSFRGSGADHFRVKSTFNKFFLSET